MPEGRITNRIRYLRFINGEMTQEQLAEKAGCTRQTIIALEQRKYHPSLLLAFRIARALGQGIEDVFQYEEQVVEPRGREIPT